MLERINSWAKRWGPLIALGGVIVAFAPLLDTWREQPKPVQSSEPVKPNQRDPAVVDRPQQTEFDQAKWIEEQYLNVKSLYENRKNLDIISIQLACLTGYEKSQDIAVSLQKKQEFQTECLKSFSNTYFVNFFEKNISGKEDTLLAKLPSLKNYIRSDPTVTSDFQAACSAGESQTFADNLQLSLSSIAAKSFLLAESVGLGAKVLEALSRGTDPFDSLPKLELFDGISETKWSSKSFRVISTFQVDPFLYKYSDDQLIRFAKYFLTMLPEQRAQAAKKLIKTYLSLYETSVIPRSNNVFGIYKDFLGDEAPMVEVNSGTLVGNYPGATLYATCTNMHIKRFWLRRILNGTDARVAMLGKKLLASF
jgi:hypothetical protein